MGNLSEPVNTIEVIKKYNFNFQKRFGQNFLIDTRVLDKIIAGADVNKDDMVIEIGPGIGTMTERLSDAAGKVFAIEIDKNLIPILNETLAGRDNVTIINDDVMKIDLKALVEKESDGKPIKVIANLPYYITTPIIMGIFEKGIPIANMTLMVQKEVGERMKVGPGTKNYGALSLAVQYYAEPYIVANVPRNCFMPRPNVDSVVIRLTRHKEPPVAVKDERLMFALIRASFNQRRKTLVNSISNSSELDYDKARIEEALAEMGQSATVRGETFTLNEFAMLTDILI